MASSVSPPVEIIDGGAIQPTLIRPDEGVCSATGSPFRSLMVGRADGYVLLLVHDREVVRLNEAAARHLVSTLTTIIDNNKSDRRRSDLGVPQMETEGAAS